MDKIIEIRQCGVGSSDMPCTVVEMYRGPKFRNIEVHSRLSKDEDMNQFAPNLRDDNG